MGTSFNPSKKTRFGRWLDARIPPTRKLTLTQRNVFIFPTLTGGVFTILVLLLLVGAVNYQNSLMFGVAFLLVGVFLTAILHTFRNLAGLTVEYLGADTAFVDEHVRFRVRVSRPENQRREGIQLGWPNTIKRWVEVYDSAHATVDLYVAGQHRGWLRPGRMLIETLFPLGLLRAWTWVDLDAQALIYPRPFFERGTQLSEQSTEAGQRLDTLGSDDFQDVRDYTPGDPVRHIMWRAFARTGDLHVKNYASYLQDSVWIDFNVLIGDTERRLSLMTGLVLDADANRREFGLRLPGVTLQPAGGASHVADALKCLALHGL